MTALSRLSGACLGCILIVLALDSATATPQPSPTDLDSLTEAKWRSWEQLLFFEDRLLGRNRSLIDAPEFFVSPTGRFDARTELRVFAELIDSDPKAPPSTAVEEEPLRCRFPRRLLWLQENLGRAKQVHTKDCAKLSGFLGTIPHNAISLVYSAQYLGNPASYFGHNFLLFKRNPHSEATPTSLIDAAVTFSADVDESNMVSYVANGLLGGFVGRFSVYPYFVHVQKYNHHERRDLWEYELNLSAAERLSLVLTLYEVLPHAASYYYLDVNCSTLIAKLVNAAVDRSPLGVDRQIWVSPIELVQKAVDKPGFVKDPIFRPSIYTELVNRYGQLTDVEKRIVDASLARGYVRDDLRSLSERRSALLYDTLADYIDYTERLAGPKPAQRFASLRHETLTKRSKLGVQNSRSAKSNSGPIDLAHRESLFEIGAGLNRSQGENRGFGILHLRPMLHGLGERDVGFTNDAAISVLGAKIEIKDNEPRLKSLDLLRLASRSPLQGIVNRPSWEVAVGIQRQLARRMALDETVKQGEMEGAFGLTLGAAKVRAFAMARSLAGTLHHEGTTPYLGLGPRLGLLVKPLNSLSLIAQSDGVWYRLRQQPILLERNTTLKAYAVTSVNTHLGLSIENSTKETEFYAFTGMFF